MDRISYSSLFYPLRPPFGRFERLGEVGPSQLDFAILKVDFLVGLNAAPKSQKVITPRQRALVY